MRVGIGQCRCMERIRMASWRRRGVRHRIWRIARCMPRTVSDEYDSAGD